MALIAPSASFTFELVWLLTFFAVVLLHRAQKFIVIENTTKTSKEGIYTILSKIIQMMYFVLEANFETKLWALPNIVLLYSSSHGVSCLSRAVGMGEKKLVLCFSAAKEGQDPYLGKI